jgi:N-acetyl-1-D-myo-inositol-2-amino-2-deoxy-alpha-D-glucopyranoside deacetylase
MSLSLLLVHAHPDDETIANGATMAAYIAQGVSVTLVTCTRGEEGEVLVPELAHLASSADNTLGEYRVGELDRAMERLNVRDHIFLGAPSKKYRDSGMMGTVQNDAPGNFWKTDLDTAAAELVALIRDRKPQVLVTYDEFGGYGHPDHIKAHQVAMRAAELAADSSYGTGSAWEISKIYWTAVPRSAVKNSLSSKRLYMKILLRVFKHVPSKWITMPFVKPDEAVTTEFDGNAYTAAKIAALKEHKTQIVMDGSKFEFSKNLALEIGGTEYYTLVKGEKAGVLTSQGRETDLFAGVRG